MQKSTGPCILLVDDEEGLRTILDDLLAHLGFRSHVAATGMHAIQKIKAGLRPDLIICDFKMPGMNGLQFVAEYKKITGAESAPFILMTGFPDKDVIVNAKAAGVKRIMVKPFPIKDLIKEISEDLKLNLNVEELVG